MKNKIWIKGKKEEAFITISIIIKCYEIDVVGKNSASRE